MTLSEYLSIQQIIMGAVMAIGIEMLFIPIPKELKGSRIDISRKFIGVATMIIPITSFIYYFTPLRYTSITFSVATNLTAYCLTSSLITLGYYALLGRIKNQALIIPHIIVGLIYPIPLWVGLCLLPESISRHIVIASYTLFAAIVIIHATICTHLYRKEKKRANNGESEIQDSELKLFKKTLHISIAVIVISLIAPSFYLYPLWLGGVFIFVFIMGVIHIYVWYHRIISQAIRTLSPDQDECKSCLVIAEANSATDALSDEVKQHIAKHLLHWLQTKEYLRADVTIYTVAKATFTNRTYLSRYINSLYGCPFKVWITRLRIDEAKELMKQNPEASITVIAQQTGFASIESFSHTFSRCEEQSPTAWREHNCL